MTTTDYKGLFEAVESTLITVGSQRHRPQTIRQRLDKFKFRYRDRRLTDNDYYRMLVFIIFTAGFRAATVEAKKKVIFQHFPDYQTVVGYGQKDIHRIMQDRHRIRNERKIKAAVENAERLKAILDLFGSFQRYVDSYQPDRSFEDLKFAEATGHPFRYVDIVFVAYGQMEFKSFGLELRGICLEKKPACKVCGVNQHCSYYAQKQNALVP